MRQRQKTLLMLTVMAAIATGVVAYTYFGVLAPEERSSAEQEANERLFSTGAAGTAEGGAAQSLVVHRITVKNRAGTTVLERRDGKWWVVQPVLTPADAVVADNVSSQLQTARFKRMIEAKPTPEDLKRYGLTEPTFEISAEAWLPDAHGGGKDDPARARRVAIKGGIENPFDGSIYLQRNDEPTVWSAEGGVRWNFDKSTFELRAKDVLAVDEPRVEALRVKNPSGTFSVARDPATKGWRFTEPTKESADTIAVAALIGALRSARAIAFVDDSPERRQALKLESPDIDVTVRLENEPPVRIRIVRVNEGESDKIYALREDGERATLAEVTDTVVSGLARTPADLRDRSVLTFDREAVAELRFTPTAGGEPVVVKRTQTADAGVAEVWEVVAPKTGPARKWKLSSILWSIGALKASDLGAEKPKDWARYGIDESARTLTLADKAGKPLAVLRVGKEDPEKPGLVPVRGSRDQVVYVDPARLGELPGALSDVLEGEPAAAADAGP